MSYGMSYVVCRIENVERRKNVEKFKIDAKFKLVLFVNIIPVEDGVR